MSRFVGNPEDRFCHAVARSQISSEAKCLTSGLKLSLHLYFLCLSIRDFL